MAAGGGYSAGGVGDRSAGVAAHDVKPEVVEPRQSTFVTRFQLHRVRNAIAKC